MEGLASPQLLPRNSTQGTQTRSALHTQLLDEAKTSVENKEYESAMLNLITLADDGNEKAHNEIRSLLLRDSASKFDIIGILKVFSNKFASPAANYFLGQYFQRTKDFENAKKYFEMAADNGGCLEVAMANFKLGVMYICGEEGIPRDVDKAFGYFETAKNTGFLPEKKSRSIDKHLSEATRDLYST